MHACIYIHIKALILVLGLLQVVGIVKTIYVKLGMFELNILNIVDYLYVSQISDKFNFT